MSFSLLLVSTYMNPFGVLRTLDGQDNIYVISEATPEIEASGGHLMQVVNVTPFDFVSASCCMSVGLVEFKGTHVACPKALDTLHLKDSFQWKMPFASR
ncbi:hypothetical protein Nepgr_014464 [Nepenthes gracilis]|uniref:Uncharacterized protein n=1 Tax=Nepenthes gracilis TaxID=150966 RepID=A0AAD3SK28_NEPGR|nr:hypothetical protein Nepgr_014464 [Nepenthes gracilis]